MQHQTRTFGRRAAGKEHGPRRSPIGEKPALLRHSDRVALDPDGSTATKRENNRLRRAADRCALEEEQEAYEVQEADTDDT